MITDFNELYAVPGENTIIDGIDPATGLTCVNGRSEAEVLQSHPDAVRMTWDEWRTQAATRQQTSIRWDVSTRAQYHEMLNVLPPAAWIGDAFLVGEPTDHCFSTGAPRFAAYWQRGDRYLVASRPLTVAELRAELRTRAV